ncbi:MAG: hypothetical protein J6K14_01360 [Clostridia bacterium]|nr:hypothetical protein [Clostridia bacterium]
MNAVKKLFLLLLSLTLAVGAFSVIASAEDGTPENEGAESNLAFTYQVGDGEVQSVESLGTPEADGAKFYELLNDKSNVTIKMYSDITLTNGVLFGTYKANPDDKTADGSKPMLDVSGFVDWDLNGHTVTVTADATPIPLVLHSDGGDPRKDVLHFIGQYTFKLYSSVQGGKYINNSSYPIFGTHKSGGYRATYVLGTNDPAVDGGENLTVISKGSISAAYETGGDTPLKINGGTYIYTGSGSAFATAATCTVNNATVITTGVAKTIFLNHYWVAANFTAKNLTVVTSDAATKLICSGGTAPSANSLNAAHKVTLEDLVLVGEGLIPQYNVNTAGKLTFSVSGNVLASEKATLDVAYPTAPDDKTLAYAGITVNGEDVVVQGYVAESEAVTVTNQTTGDVENWIAKDGYFYVLRNASTSDVALKKNGVWYCYTNPTWVATLDGNAIEMNTICDASNAGKDVALEITSDNIYPIAFSYQVDGGEVQFVESKGTPEEDGANFVTLLDKVCNVKIVMYTDIVLSTGVRFGTMVDVEVTYTSNNKTTTVTTQRPYYTGPSKDPKSSEYGTVDWDLNGNTVTVAADATPISMIAWTEGQGPQSNNVLHYPGYVNFRLYSSVAGGEYINLSSYTIFGINKYSNASYSLGAGDDNLTIVSKGQITGAYETTENGPAGYTLTVNGGTYVSSTNGAVFSVGRTVKINNAKILATGGAFAIFSNHFWSDGTSLTLDNVTMIASASTTQMVTSGAFSVANGNGKTHYIYLNNTIAFSGGTLSLAYTKATFTVNGTIMTDTAENLAVAYPTAPEGQTLAYTGISVYGESRAVGGYYSAPETVTIVNATQNETKLWLVGEERFFVGGDSSSSFVMKVDGVWYYYTAPVWEATLGGNVVAIESVCAAENAGKTVTVALGGEKEKLYYSHATPSGITYYYGDTAAATLSTLLSPMDSQKHEFRFYSDIEVSSGAASYQLGRKNYDATILVDLNGYKWTVNSSNGYAFIVTGATTFVYSSVSGGILDVSTAAGIACTDGSADAYFGEATKTGTEYGQNLTVYCKSVHSGRWWSNNGYIVGGTYVQPEGVTAEFFFGIDDGPVTVVRNSAFIVNSLSGGFVRGVKGSFTNCVFIAKEASNIVMSGKSNTGATFTGCYFYNVIPNIPEGTAVTYTDCNFNLAPPDEQVGGYIAYTGENVVKTIAGKDYTFTAKLLAEDAIALVDWGFGIKEYWKFGATATHADATVDGIFVYGFAPVAVTSGGAVASSTLKSVASGTILTALSVENDITFRLLVPMDAGFVKVVFDGTEWILADLTPDADGYYVIHAAYSPSKAAEAISIEVTGAYAHTFALTLEAYASAVLADETLADAHNVTYAMVKYVELMSGKTVAVDAPAGYEAQTLVAAPSANTVGLLTNISICHDEAITVGVTGTVGTAVKITYTNGAVVEGVVGENKMVAISCPALHALAGDLTITAGEESYTYNLANYLYHQTDDEVIAQLQALYNYACYASQYVAVTAQVAE